MDQVHRAIGLQKVQRCSVFGQWSLRASNAFIEATLSEWVFSPAIWRWTELPDTWNFRIWSFQYWRTSWQSSTEEKITVSAISQDGIKKNFTVLCRIDTPNEVDYYKHNGILQYVLRSLLKPDHPATEQQRKPLADGKTQKYRILFNGEIEQGQNLPAVKEHLAQLFKTSPEQIEKLFTGRPVTININLEYTAAQEYITLMKNAGAFCYFEPMKVLPSPQSSGMIKGGQRPAAVKSGAVEPSRILSAKNGVKTKTTNPRIYTHT